MIKYKLSILHCVHAYKICVVGVWFWHLRVYCRCFHKVSEKHMVSRYPLWHFDATHILFEGNVLNPIGQPESATCWPTCGRHESYWLKDPASCILFTCMAIVRSSNTSATNHNRFPMDGICMAVSRSMDTLITRGEGGLRRAWLIISMNVAK